MRYLSLDELEAGFENAGRAPADRGVLEMIVRRPEPEAREVLREGVLDLSEGLVGDNWRTRGNASVAEQVTVMCSRVIALLAREVGRWPLAGDQLYVDLDLSIDNVPPRTRLSVGSAVIEATDRPHLGCKKFAARYGRDALKFVNSPVGRQLQLRGINARVVEPGTIRVGDRITKLPP